ncbi:hypothetical protein GQR58_023659 [Nymphon striatum]|nr:hypothetical protein GQR58_023659 [Nymphon striatum]
MLSYLASSWSQEASWPAGFCLVLGVNAQATRVTQTEHTDVDELYCPNHEEADTRIFAHIASCDDNKVFVIQATDTDIIFLAMYHFPRLPNVVELWVEKNDLFLSIHDLVNELAKAVGKDVLALTDTLLISYILSSCDSVCYPFKRGKKRTVKVALEHVDKHSTLSNCIRHKSGPSAHDQVITEARSFFCDLYGTPGYLSLDKLRAHLFPSRKLDLRSLPPTEDAFHFHVLRNLCQICLYKQASFSNPVLLPPEEYGRIVDGDRLIPVMKSKPSKPSAAKLKYFCTVQGATIDLPSELSLGASTVTKDDIDQVFNLYDRRWRMTCERSEFVTNADEDTENVAKFERLSNISIRKHIR